MLKSCLRSVSDLELRTWFKLWPRNYKHIISCKRQTLYHLPSLWWNYLFNYFNGYLNNCTTFLVYAPNCGKSRFHLFGKVHALWNVWLLKLWFTQNSARVWDLNVNVMQQDVKFTLNLGVVLHLQSCSCFHLFLPILLFLILNSEKHWHFFKELPVKHT